MNKNTSDPNGCVDDDRPELKASDLSGWVDYDRPKLELLNKKEKILYFRKRINMVLIKPLDYMYDHLINKTLKNISVLLCWANCICCSIEAFGKFYTGNTKSGYSRKNFETFISSYMNGDFYEKKLNKKYYGKILWDDFRNGIAHGFTIKSGGFEHNYNEYFRIEKTNSLLIDPAKFYDDFKKAVNLFCEDLNSDDSKYKTFEKVFEEVFIEGK